MPILGSQHIIPMDDDGVDLVSVVDSGNSSVAQLIADASFVGTGVDCERYASIAVMVHSDQNSAADGMVFEFSMDNTNWDDSYPWTMDVSESGTRRFQFPVTAKYFRVNYTNGGTVTTQFRCQTILHRTNILTSVHRIETEVSKDRSAQVVKAAIIAQQAGSSSQSFVPVGADADGHLKVTLSESEDDPIVVTISTGDRSYYHVYLTQNDEPAEILSTTGPFDVGGDTLTISVNGGTNQTPTFSTRVAQQAIHYSGPNPATANPDDEKIKVSVDGGALLEVKCGKGLSSGAAIAAAYQTQIRALVENGSNVTVEYDTVDYPLRYVFKSGNTGSSSTIHVEKGGDDSAVMFKLGAYGGSEYSGLDADYYHNYEVVDFLATELSDVVVHDNGDEKTKIQTVAGGTSATLQVTAGGANTAFQFPTTLETGSTGSGSNELNVDGSSTALRYSLTIPDGKVFVAQKVIFYIRDDDAQLKRFGGLTELTNGLKFEVKNEYLPLISVFTAKTNSMMMTFGEEGDIVFDAFAADGKDLVKAVYDFGAGLRIPEGADANVYATVQDDLTGLNSCTILVKGWVE